MIFRRFYATDEAREHMLDKHAVEWEEAEGVLCRKLRPRRARPGPGGEKRCYVDGITEDGRCLRVILALEPPNTARVITAYGVR